MASRKSYVVQLLVVLLLMVQLLQGKTITDDRGRQFEEREILVPTGISDAELQVEIQKAIRELYPNYKDSPDIQVKQLSSVDELVANKGKAAKQ